MSLYYSRDDKCYLPDRTFPDDELGRRISNAAVSICRAYGYDINMVEFVIHHGRPYLINPTNPAPDIDRALLSPEQFQWCVDEIADFAIRKAKEEPSQRMLISIPQEKQDAGA